MDKLTTVYFSKDRPAQLDLTLKTNKRHCHEWDLMRQFVLYKPSTDKIDDFYTSLAEDYPEVLFIKEEDFKEDLLDILVGSDSMFFIVDDCIFTRNYSVFYALAAISNIDSLIGFSLRLGENTTVCYPLEMLNEIPTFYDALQGDERGNPAAVFNWQGLQGDFGYPLELSSSIYPTRTMKKILLDGQYNSPNSLESIMDINKFTQMKLKHLACHRTSIAFCNPINKVQKENNNKAGKNKLYSVESLLINFEAGYRLKDIYSGFTSNGCHQEVDIEWELKK